MNQNSSQSLSFISPTGTSSSSQEARQEPFRANISNQPFPDVLIYHKGCPDGIGGAWAFWSKLFNKEHNRLYPGTFDKVIPFEDCKDKVIYFVDFTYPKDITENILKVAKHVVVLDHHKTALQLNDLANYPNLTLVIDMDRSGAQIAWDFVNPKIDRLWFIDDIADRDLWRWVIPDSKLVTKAMFSMGFYETFETFDQIQTQDRKELVKIGKLLVDNDENIYKMICKRSLECWCYPPKTSQDPATKALNRYKVKVVETGHFFASDVGNILSSSKMSDGTNCDFAVVCRYSLKDNEWWLSLRAGNDSNVDLTEVAKGFDKGGGHKKATGVTLFCNKGQTLDSVFVPIDNKVTN